MHRTVRTAFLVTVVIIPAISVLAQSDQQLQLNSEYRKWLDQDVHWIMTDEEQDSFLQLTSDADRDHFVVAFWQRRNPTPGGEQNPFKEEHYRRLAFANQHFAGSATGWMTDRGRVYIVYGPPDSIEMHPLTSASPAEQVWIYRHMQGKSSEVQVRFHDRCRCGQYELETPMQNIR